ncbi:MAG TPA: hypothetical protein VNJ01_12115 [Bacteriovoracaceae bacterium]|nr:hypothetical protein [Bacteriovoracaceae bacterium]
MKWIHLALVLTLFTFSNSHACVGDQDGLMFFPANDLRIPVGLKGVGGIDKAAFNEVLDQAQSLFENKIKQQGFTLRVNRLWTNEQVNAQASAGGELSFYGGLARHPDMSRDGFALAVCHEIGHLIGGFPKYPGSRLSAESQSDYYGTLKCLRQMFLNDDNRAAVARLNPPRTLKQNCTAAHGVSEDRDICIRSGLAAAQLATLLAKVTKESTMPGLDLQDSRVVPRTLASYPSAQCRLDTFLQGALCEKGLNEEVSQTEEVRGSCHQSTGQRIGLRPACWFKVKP